MNLFPFSLTKDKEDIKIIDFNFVSLKPLLKIEYTFEIIKNLERILELFFDNLTLTPSLDIQHIIIIGKKGKLFLGKNVHIEGVTVVNLSKGSVFISDNVTLKNFNSIEGPVYIGEGSTLDSSTIRGPFVCGKVCKISGEIEESLFFDYVNKHHYGFIGHSIVGSWVNLGAGTTNSDLKNNYSTIKVFDGKDYIDTRMQKFGCIIGDHVKTSIGTMINTGTVIGPFSNIFQDIRDKKYIKPFSWGNEKIYEKEKLIDDIKKVMARRDLSPDEEFIRRISNLYEIYSSESTF